MKIGDIVTNLFGEMGTIIVINAETSTATLHYDGVYSDAYFDEVWDLCELTLIGDENE